jgi:hypothetical protein
MLEALLDPTRRAKAAADQEKRRETMGHLVSRDPAVSNYNYGLARERFALSLPEGPARDAILVEAYALQGRYADAAKLADDRSHWQYGARMCALNGLNQRQCSCPDRTIETQAGNAKGQYVPTLTKIEKVFVRGEAVVTFYRCRLCGYISAFGPSRELY